MLTHFDFVSNISKWVNIGDPLRLVIDLKVVVLINKLLNLLLCARLTGKYYIST